MQQPLTAADPTSPPDLTHQDQVQAIAASAIALKDIFNELHARCDLLEDQLLPGGLELLNRVRWGLDHLKQATLGELDRELAALQAAAEAKGR